MLRKNSLYRELIVKYHTEYCGLNGKDKREFARTRIVNEIQTRGGKFYKEHDTKKGCWVEVRDISTILDKVMQAFRDERSRAISIPKSIERKRKHGIETTCDQGGCDTSTSYDTGRSGGCGNIVSIGAAGSKANSSEEESLGDHDPWPTNSTALMNRNKKKKNINQMKKMEDFVQSDYEASDDESDTVVRYSMKDEPESTNVHVIQQASSSPHRVLPVQSPCHDEQHCHQATSGTSIDPQDVEALTSRIKRLEGLVCFLMKENEFFRKTIEGRVCPV